jgi:carboxypeptidase C (cathepsin A)
MIKSRIITITFTLTIFLILGNHQIVSRLDDLVDNLPDFPYGGRMFSGYLNLSSPLKKLHYVFVESQRDREKDPLILWLNGGPGCSSLLGWAQENGPASFKEGSTEFQINPYSWNKIANVLYLESPAGVGFSTINSNRDYDWSVDDQSSGKQNLEALLDFFKKFPNYRNNDLYISGESYAGIYVPVLVSKILDWNEHQIFDNFKINLKGMIIGNGVTDWAVDTEPALMDFAFTHSLYSYELREEFLNQCKVQKDKDKCRIIKDKILEVIDDVNIYDIYRKCFDEEKKIKLSSDFFSFSDFYEETSNKKRYIYTPWVFSEDKQRKEETDNEFLTYLSEDNKSKMSYGSAPCVDTLGPYIYFNRDDVKRALNVDISLKWEMCSTKVSEHYKLDRSKGSFYLYPKLLNSNIKILIYSGDTDAAVPYNGTQQWITNLKLPIISGWASWKVDDDNIAGFRSIYKGLTFVTVKGTGHMVPQWKPKETFHMISRFLDDRDL